MILSSKNEAWNKKLSQLDKIAQSDLPVLLQGETGTGKEILAKEIHQKSHRNKNQFLTVNCSALNESIIESELFGHNKGSYTGAIENRLGIFRAANNGTVLLDEIGDLPLSLQPKLLRTLENNEVKPVGQDKEIKINVRIIAATHKNLNEMVAQGLFRKDLFFRLNIIKINIPPLAQRIEDFDAILYHYAREYKVRFSFEAIQTLKNHTWPGNIRELKSIIMKSSVLFDNILIKDEHINELIEKPLQSQNYDKIITKHKSVIKNYEENAILDALKITNGNMRKASELLGIPKSTFHDKATRIIKQNEML